MADLYKAALIALENLKKEVGADSKFPGDKIWNYSKIEIPSANRPGLIRKLHREGLIEKTGKSTNAVSAARAGSPTTEYGFPRDKSPKATPLISDIATAFHNACKDQLHIPFDLCLRFIAALMSKRLVILTGLSGSGKTRVAQAFARWISPEDPATSTYTVIPVGADWTGSDSIIGYPDGLNPDQYVMKPALELILRALENPAQPHFLILDEMNLSHVERYFSDLLSALESGEEIPLYEGAERKSGGWPIPRFLPIPENLFVIGTVNVDETTYMFSPKVLDRANVIEFRVNAQEIRGFARNPLPINISSFDGVGEGYGESFGNAASSAVALSENSKKRFEEEIDVFFSLLAENDAEFGFRSVFDAARFVSFFESMSKKENAFDAAMDGVVVQKLLPKLHGSRTRLEGLLWSLASACGPAIPNEKNIARIERCKIAGRAEDESLNPENLLKKYGESEPRYPLSYLKILRMWRKLIRDQFASFAEA